MLSKSDNEYLTRVGPGTPMGELLRRFWMPALLEAEVPTPDCDPVRLRLMGEDLVAFRDSNGRVGILEAYCPHRQAHLYFGRNEDCGLRCVYHGWKFDVDGNCVDMPSEPADSSFKDKVKLTSYPAVVRGGVVWIYMGPRETMAELPDLEFAYLPDGHRTAIKRLQRCNWAQAVEGGIDSAHISYLHSTISMAESEAMRNHFNRTDRAPVFDVSEVDYGLMIGARRNAGENEYYWRITQFLLPFYQMIPPVVPDRDSSAAPYSGHAWVPIDDENSWTWTFGANPHRRYSDAELERQGGLGSMWGPVDETYYPLHNMENEYLLDRAKQRQGHFTGIDGIANQDCAVQESMGPIVDRTKEHLGTTDRAITLFRRLMLRLARDLEQGSEPAAAHHGHWYNVRSVSIVLGRDVPFVEGAKPLMGGGEIRAAAE